MSDSNWRGMFEQQQSRLGRPLPDAPPIPTETDDGLSVDLTAYQPWILQRAKSRPAMMLDLRCYEPRSGMWGGWAVAYPHLVAVEYTGDRMVSLDFGGRQFVVEGHGLGDLVRHLQLGSVLAIQQFAPTIWPPHPQAAVVSAIRKI